MDFTIEINYRQIGNYKELNTLYLKPDEPISPYFNGSFNWIGSVNIEGEIVKIKILQRSVQDDPTIEDINIDRRVLINKQEILDKIANTLNRNLS